MSFPKESVFPSVSGLPTSTKSEHMVCSDPACPTTSDPFTGRITCRCYQISELRDQAQNPQVYTTSGYPGLYPTSYPMETQPSATSPLQSNPGMNPYTTSMMSNAAYPPQFIPQGTTMPQLDNILRSQVYNYMYPGVMDLNGIARRKNATRETTSALKAWLQQHKKNPYPTKAEKIMLAIVTKMTLTQVSTWFANARRRLKKEHKGEWSSDNSFDNGSDNENDDHDSDDASKQNNSLNHPSFTERLPLLHSTPIPNRVPDLPKEHTSNTNINAQDRLPGFTSFAPLSSNSANQNNPQCSISPPLHPYSHSSMMSSVPQTFPPLPLSAAPVTQNHYALYNGMKYDNHMYAQPFPRTSHLDSEGDSNQNLSGSSFDESDKENAHISGSSHSSNSVSPLVTKSTKVPSNSADSKPRIWSISHIIGGPEKQPSVSSPDTVQCPVVTKDVTDTSDSQSLENIIVS